MEQKSIKLIIESKLENVALLGMAINKLCSLTPLSEVESYQVELCVVEAVNNSIKHAYEGKACNEVEVVFTLYPSKVVVDVCDRGKSMEQSIFNEKQLSALEVDPNDIMKLSESGRGIPIIKEVMDSVVYKSKEGKNCLTMIKRLEARGGKDNDSI
ncbi:MAG: ATP-binding protein [Deltaproteobacteria bacterium]|nr:ATP-binding protein [Deltaproteobacteria bacterium]